MSSDERDARLHKLFGLPCDNTMCGGMWRFDDPERGITCYIASGSHDLISCVRVDDLELVPTAHHIERRPHLVPIQ